jgi:GH24 family phage-related lysozyme (muramidase)
VTQDEAERLLQAQLQTRAEAADLHIKWKTPKPHELGAMYSLLWNIGSAAFADSTLLRLYNLAGPGEPVFGPDGAQVLRYGGAAGQFLLWNKSRGVIDPQLARRRAYEQKVFVGTIDVPVQETS